VEQSGVSQIITVIETNPFYRADRIEMPGGSEYYTTAPERFWQTCESAFQKLAYSAELVLVVRLGAYVEIDFEQFVQFHLQQSSRVSQVMHTTNAAEVFCIDASRHNDVPALFRGSPSRCRSAYASFPYDGYINPLGDAHDLRQFAIDVLTLRTKTKPVGRQLRPGIWIGLGAVVEHGSRIVAPAFIGSSARIRAGVLVTRCTAIERHAHVDCGTVIENSTVLPYCYVGAGLDLAHSVVGMGQIANLRRSATVAVADRKLIGQVASGAGRRLLAAAARALSGVMFAKNRPRLPELGPLACPEVLVLEEAGRFPEAAQNVSIAGEVPSPVAVARRYGDQ
jgi:hypothetical protein